MTDSSRIVALRGLEVDVAPDPEFAAALLAVLQPRVREARRRERSLAGRIRRQLRWRAVGRAPTGTGATTTLGRAGVIAALLALLVVAAILIAGRKAPTVPIRFFFDGHVLSTSADGSAPYRLSNLGIEEALSPDGAYSAASVMGTDLAGGQPGYVGSRVVITELTTLATQPLEAPVDGASLTWSSRDVLAWTVGRVEGQGVAHGVSFTRPGDAAPRTWIVPDAAFVNEIAWAPDGTALAVSTWRMTCEAGGAPRLFLVDPESLTAREFPLGSPDGSADGLRWSPDARSIAANIGPSGPCGTEGVLVGSLIDAATGTVQPIGQDVSVLGWTGDGAWIVTGDGGDTPDSPSRITLVRRDLGERRVLVTTEFESVSIAPDGSLLAFTALTPDLVLPSLPPKERPYGGLASLFVLRLSDGSVHRIADGLWSPRGVAWTADSRWLVFARSEIGSLVDHTKIAAARTLWVIRPDGTGEAPIASVPIVAYPRKEEAPPLAVASQASTP